MAPGLPTASHLTARLPQGAAVAGHDAVRVLVRRIARVCYVCRWASGALRARPRARATPLARPARVLERLEHFHAQAAVEAREVLLELLLPPAWRGREGGGRSRCNCVVVPRFCLSRVAPASALNRPGADPPTVSAEPPLERPMHRRRSRPWCRRRRP